MTTTLRSSQHAVPAADEIRFPALERPTFLILVADGQPDGQPDAAATAQAGHAGGPAAGRAIGEVVRTIAPDAVFVPTVGPGFANMAGIAAVRAALLPVIQREAPELCGDEWLASGLSTAARRVRRVGISYLAESVTFAVTRRISRESHQSALIIDRIARTLLRAVRECPTFAAGLTLVVPDLYGWDRPSLRCLYRLALLAGPADRVSVIALAERPVRPGAEHADDLETRIARARVRFFDRLAATGVARIAPLPGSPASDGPAPPDDAPAPGDTPAGDTLPPEDVPDDYAELLLAIGDALVFQNYERVYHLSRYALARADDAEREAQARRLIAIADAQLDDFEVAGEGLRKAVQLTTDRSFAAHLHYLQGLIATKRHYDLDAADEHYAHGLDALGDAGSGDGTAPGPEPEGGTGSGHGAPLGDGATLSEDVQCRVERSWLYNGQALVRTLRAKATGDSAAREQLMAKAFDLELKAFALVRGVPGAAPAYLRHNLMANLTFLLEISRRFDDAVRFWTRAFEAYLASDSREFRQSFDARLGLLLVKAGRREEGIEVLEQARAVCRDSGDRFAEEEVCLKLAYAYGTIGDHERAYRAYLDGFRTAHELRELDICLDALAGMLWSLAELGADDSFAALDGAIRQALPASTLAERLGKLPAAGTGTAPQGAAPQDLVAALDSAGVRRPAPSPKLRAYIAGVDLEGTPTQDLNRYLVWSGGALSRPSRDNGTVQT